MGVDQTKQTGKQDQILSVNSSATKTEQIHDLAIVLANNFQKTSRGRSGRLLIAPFLEHDIPGHDLSQIKSWLAEAHRFFSDTSHQEVSLTYASEWVLDNYYIIRQALRQIQEDLPSEYYAELPRLTTGSLKDFPRIYAIAHTVLQFQHLLLDPSDLQTILIQFQEYVPLTMGEVWALPIFLRYCLVEFLAHTLVETIRPPDRPDLPEPVPQILQSSDHLFDETITRGEASERWRCRQYYPQPTDHLRTELERLF